MNQPQSAVSAPSKPAKSSTPDPVLAAAIVCASVASVGLLLYTLTRRPKSKQAEKSTPQETNIQPLPVTKLVKIFAQITLQMQSVILKLAQEEQAILSRQDLNLTNQQVQEFLLNRFQENVTEIEKAVYLEHKTSELQVKTSCTLHEGNASLVAAIAQLKSVYSAVMNTSSDQAQKLDQTPVPDHLTMDKTLQVLIDTMLILRTEAAALSETLRQQGITREKNLEEFQAEFQTKYAELVETGRDALYKKEGIESDLIMQAAVRKYQNDETFQNELKRESVEHNAKMGSLGFAVPDMPSS